MSEERAKYKTNRELVEAVKAFIEQVEKIEYRDFYGNNVKTNLAFLKLKEAARGLLVKLAT